MANKILASLKAVSPKQWLIMGGGLLVVIFISRAKGGSTSPMLVSGGSSGADSSVMKDAINQQQYAMNNATEKLTSQMAAQSEKQAAAMVSQSEKQSAALAIQREESVKALAAQNEASGKLFSSLSDTFSKSLATLKGDINNVTDKLQKLPQNVVAPPAEWFGGQPQINTNISESSGSLLGTDTKTVTNYGDGTSKTTYNKTGYSSGTNPSAGQYKETVSGVTYSSNAPSAYNGGGQKAPSYYNKGVPQYL